MMVVLPDAREDLRMGIEWACSTVRQTLAAAAIVAAGLAPLSPDHAVADEYASDQVILRLGPSGNLDSLNAAWGTIAIDSIAGRGIYLLHLTDPSVQDSMVNWPDDSWEYCDYDYEGQSPEARRQVIVIAIGATGTDVEDQGAMARARKDEAHAIATGEGALVAVLDTGVEIGHPFLAGRLEVAYGADFVDEDGDPSEVRNGVDDDDDGQTDEGAGHGTMVAGIVATIAPDARIIPIRVLDDEGRGTIFSVLQGLYRAREMGARVMNLSLGTEESSQALEDAIDELAWEGAIVVAASGNDSVYRAQYPARYSATIAVTATDSTDVKADFANYASAVDMSAPGVGILSTFLDGGFGLGLGTSFSTPFISGALALVLERFPSAARSDLRDWVMYGSASIDSIPGNEPFEGKLGAGRVDCVGVLEAAVSPAGVPPPGPTPWPQRPGATISPPFAVPNPSPGQFTLRFALDQDASVRVRVFSPDGRLVRMEPFGRLSSGTHAVSMDLRGGADHALPPGRYLYRIDAGASHAAGTLTIVR